MLSRSSESSSDTAPLASRDACRVQDTVGSSGRGILTVPRILQSLTPSRHPNGPKAEQDRQEPSNWCLSERNVAFYDLMSAVPRALRVVGKGQINIRPYDM